MIKYQIYPECINTVCNAHRVLAEYESFLHRRLEESLQSGSIAPSPEQIRRAKYSYMHEPLLRNLQKWVADIELVCTYPVMILDEGKDD